MTEEEKVMLQDYETSRLIQGSTLSEVFSSDLSGFTKEFKDELKKLFTKELMS